MLQHTGNNGNIFIIHGLPKFCKINNLNPCNMSLVASGKSKNHKNWLCEKVSKL
jgi:hypothetical protein